MHNEHIITAWVLKCVNSLYVRINCQRTVQMPSGENNENY